MSGGTKTSVPKADSVPRAALPNGAAPRASVIPEGRACSTATAEATPWARLRSRLTATRALEEEDRRRELALNWILIASTLLAMFEAAVRLPAVIEGGAGAADHGPTVALSCLAAAAFVGLLAASRSGRQVTAAWGLLAADYGVIVWLFVAEGTEEPAAIVLCAIAIVTAGVLLGARVSTFTVVLITATLIVVSSLASAGVLHPAGESASVVGEIGLGGGLGLLTMMLSARTSERRQPAGQLLAGVGVVAGAEVEEGVASIPSALSAVLTVRELQVVQLIAAGHANAQIARELFLSPRTVHTHVSNALRKTGCSNRTELAVLAIRDGPSVDRQTALSISTAD